MGKGLYNLLVPQHLVDQGRHLAPGLRLVLEHDIGPSGNEAGHHQRNRRQAHHHRGDQRIDIEHKAQGSQNGHHAGKQLGKSHKQAVGKLVDVGNDPADHVAGGMGVHIPQRQLLQMLKRPGADVLNHPVGNLVVDMVHQPLGRSSGGDHNPHADEDLHQPLKIYLAGGHDPVHRLSGENGHIQRAGHRHCGQQKGNQDTPFVMADIV